MGKRIYKCVTGAFTALTPKMKTTWEEPFAGEPCVFICNHVGAFGPIYMVTKFPLKDQCHAWMNHDMLDPKLIPAYVRQDYWWKPGCWAEPLLNVTLPYLAAAIIPPVVRGAPVVPVYHDNRALKTMRESLRLLKEGRHLIIFPEQPSGFQSHHDWINTGFLHVAPMYHRLTGKALRFYPVHIDYKKGHFKIARPIVYDPERSLEDQLDEIVHVLANGLRGIPVSTEP